MTTPDAPQIRVTDSGPYRVVGEIAIADTNGNELRTGGSWCLCRCGGSRNKPFCDGTHGMKEFRGEESADHGRIEDRRDSYTTEGVTVYDDRSRCAHYGQCTTRLASVFRHDAEPFVDPNGAPPEQIPPVVAGCPSGALAYAQGDDPRTVEQHEPPSITPIVDGPYRVRGSVQVVGADGRAYERRERQTPLSMRTVRQQALLRWFALVCGVPRSVAAGAGEEAAVPLRMAWRHRSTRNVDDPLL